MKPKQKYLRTEPLAQYAFSSLRYHGHDRICGRVADDTLYGGTRFHTAGYWYADDLQDAGPGKHPSTQCQRGKILGPGGKTRFSDPIKGMPSMGTTKDELLSRLVEAEILRRILTGEALSGVEIDGLVGPAEEPDSLDRERRDEGSLLEKDGGEETIRCHAELSETAHGESGAECSGTERFDSHLCELCGPCHERVRVSIASQVATSPTMVLVTERVPVPKDSGSGDLTEVLEERDPASACFSVEETALSGAPRCGPFDRLRVPVFPYVQSDLSPRGA